MVADAAERNYFLSLADDLSDTSKNKLWRPSWHPSWRPPTVNALVHPRRPAVLYLSHCVISDFPFDADFTKDVTSTFFGHPLTFKKVNLTHLMKNMAHIQGYKV